MLNISKLDEPSELTEYRKRPDAAWDGPGFAPVKRKIRESLRIEQKGLCAYCMRELGKFTRIEHHIARTACTSEAEKLKYANMLLCCNGYSEDEEQNAQLPPKHEGETEKDYKKRIGAKSKQTCDLHKHGKAIQMMPNPADPLVDIEQSVAYSNRDGAIVVPHNWKEDVEVTLNLNEELLKLNRKKAMDKYMHLFMRDGRTKAAEIKRLRNPNVKNAPQYLGCILYLLKLEN